MKTYCVAQKAFDLNDNYIINRPRSKEIAYTIKGKFSLSPALEMRAADKSSIPIKQIKGNFLRTRFQIFDNQNNSIGSIEFPLLSLKKHFTLHIGNKKYNANGGFSGWKFQCLDEKGIEIFNISKENTLSDRFEVNIQDDVPEEIALITAVAIDQKYFYQE